jgi:hypothetical protein
MREIGGQGVHSRSCALDEQDKLKRAAGSRTGPSDAHEEEGREREGVGW